MPLYADMYYSYLGSSPSVSSTLYGSGIPGSHYGSTPLSRLGGVLGSSSYTRTAHNFYPPSALTSLSSYSTSRYIPKLTTISESLGNARLNRAHQHHRPHVRRTSPRPITINTSDIDVSASKYEGKRRASREEAPEARSHLQQGSEVGERPMRSTISRNRKCVRLNTVRKAKSRSQSKDRSSSKKKKEEEEEEEVKKEKKSAPAPIEPVVPVKQEEPPPSPRSPTTWREKIPSELLAPPKKTQPEKSPGEIFMEKFIIRNPPASASKKPASITKLPEKKEEPVFVYPPTVPHAPNKGRRTSITLQGLEQLPTFSDICQDISSDKIDDDLNAGALRRRASLIIDEELEIFNNLRKGSQSTVTCVLEKELDSDQEIDSEGNKLKKPKQKVAAKVDITNASITDLKEFVESIKDEIQDTTDKKPPKINVVLEAVEEISMIPVKIPAKRRKPKPSHEEEVKKESDSGVKMRKKSVMRKSVKANKDTEENRKSDIDFWGSLDRSETQEFQIRAAKVWEKFERRQSQEWIIDVGEAQTSEMKSITKDAEKKKTETKLESSKSAGVLEEGKKIKTDLSKSKTMSSLKQEEPKLDAVPIKKKVLGKVKDEPATTLASKSVAPLKKTVDLKSKPENPKAETNYAGALMKDGQAPSLTKVDQSKEIPEVKDIKPVSKKEEVEKDPKTDPKMDILTKVRQVPSKDLKQSKSGDISSKPSMDESLLLEKSKSLTDAKLPASPTKNEVKPKEKHPLALLKQRLDFQKARSEEPSKVQQTAHKKPTPKRGISCEKVDAPVKIQNTFAPVQFKSVTDLVKADTQNGIESVITEPEKPKVPKVVKIEDSKESKDPPKLGTGLSKAKSVKDVSTLNDENSKDQTKEDLPKLTLGLTKVKSVKDVSLCNENDFKKLAKDGASKVAVRTKTKEKLLEVDVKPKVKIGESNDPIEVQTMVAPAQLKSVADNVKINTQNATESIMPETEVPKVSKVVKIRDSKETTEPPKVGVGLSKVKSVKDVFLLNEDEDLPKLGTGLNKVKSVKDVFIFNDEDPKKLAKDDTGSGKVKVALRTKTQEKLLLDEVKPKVKADESEKDDGQKKPVEKDVQCNKLGEKVQIRPALTSDVKQQQPKKLTTTSPNVMKNKICDGGGEQSIKIESGKKAKSPETGSRCVDTDTRFTNDAHAIISDVAADKLSANQCVLLGDGEIASTTATVKSQMKKHLNDSNAQDDKSSAVVVGATSTGVTDNKSSAALRKDTHFDKGKAIAMTNVKDADAQQQTTTGSGDVVEVCDDANLTTVNNIINKKDKVDDESIVINEKSDEKDIGAILDAIVRELPINDHDNADTQNALSKFPTCNNLTDLTVEHDQLNHQLDITCATETNLTGEVTEDNCTLRSSKEAGKPIPLNEDEEQDLQKEPQTQVNKIESSDSNTEETSFSTDCSATEDWSSEESEDEEEKQRLKARENLLLLLRMARNDDTPVAAKPAPQKKMLLDLDKMKKCYAKEEKAVITLVAKPKPLWKYVRRNKPHKRRNRKLLEKAQEMERLEREGDTSEHAEPNATHSDDSQASDANSSTKNSKSSASSDYTEYYDFSFPYYVKDEDNNLLVNSRLSQRSIDSGIGGGSSEASSSLKDPTGESSYFFDQKRNTRRLHPSTHPNFDNYKTRHLSINLCIKFHLK